jgi:hypothetical protein
MYVTVPLELWHLDRMFDDLPVDDLRSQLPRSYFSPGSVSRCVLAEGEPVFAGGIVNLMWNRGEAWMLPTAFFRSHVKTCMQAMKAMIPALAKEGGFIRVQSSCVQGVSECMFRHLGFDHEGTIRHWGPKGETCEMYSRIFEKNV